MIRINLLAGPGTKAVAGQWDLRVQAGGMLGLVMLAIGTCLVWNVMLNSEIEAKELDKQEKTKQVAKLKQQVKQVGDLEKAKKLLEDRTRIIAQLEKGRGGPVRALDYVSQSLEPLKLWLVNLNLVGTRMELDGRALTNNDIVGFVNHLRRSDYFSDIQLLESRSGTQGQFTVYHFRMNLTLKG